MGTEIQRGYEATLYVRTAGTYASPTWSEIDLARDVTDLRDHEDIDVTTRGSARRGYKASMAGTTPAGFEFEALVPAAGETNAAFSALLTALKANAIVDILHVEGGDLDTDDLTAERIQCCLTGGGKGEPLSGAATQSFSAKFTPNSNTNAPETGTTADGAFVSDES